MQLTFSTELQYIKRAPHFLYLLLQAAQSNDLGIMPTLEGVSQKEVHTFVFYFYNFILFNTNCEWQVQIA